MNRFYTIFLLAAAMLLFPAGPSFAGNPLHEKQLEDTGNCPSCDLNGVNLNGRNLTGANLSNADLFGADFIRTTLTEANLSNTDLTEAIFFEANLTGANLENARLKLARFAGANLQKANLRGVKEISLGDFFGADLTGATWKDGTKCKTPDCSVRE